MNSKVSVFGLGYVGSVTAACLASKGNSVIGVDLSPSKVEQPRAGRSPIVEPRLKELVESAHAASTLRAIGQCLREAELIVIATRGVRCDQLLPHLRTDHALIDLVNLEKARRPALDHYEGICW